MTASIDWLVVGGAVEPWTALGLVSTPVDEHGRRRIPLFGTGIEVDERAAPGLGGMVLSGADADATSIDGVPVEVRPAPGPMFADHRLGARSIDHVVIATDDLVRTCGAVADVTGAPLKRVRGAGGGVRQGFHRVGGLIVEVVERSGLEPGPATLWGLVLIVDDLAAACQRLGPDVISVPRDAVQPGRSIATVSAATGLGLPVALMSPDLR